MNKTNELKVLQFPMATIVAYDLVITSLPVVNGFLRS